MYRTYHLSTRLSAQLTGHTIRIPTMFHTHTPHMHAHTRTHTHYTTQTGHKTLHSLPTLLEKIHKHTEANLHTHKNNVYHFMASTLNTEKQSCLSLKKHTKKHHTPPSIKHKNTPPYTNGVQSLSFHIPPWIICCNNQVLLENRCHLCPLPFPLLEAALPLAGALPLELEACPLPGFLLV